MNVKNGFTKRKRYIKRITHLFMNDKNLTTIDVISLPAHLTVIYFYNNNIAKIENLEAATNLKSLYFQKNKILKIENLNSLRSLTKLYLGHNEISVVEGLELLNNLEELHLEKQRLKIGDSLCFDPRSIIGIAGSLKYLNVSHNNIMNITSLAPLKCLKYIDVSFNQLKNMTEVCNALQNWYYLHEAVIKGNLICGQPKFRENLIAHSYNLAILDHKEVNDITRRFIKLFVREKQNKSRQSINLASNVPDIAKNYPLTIQKAVSQSILRDKLSILDTALQIEGNEVYLPWKAMPKTISNVPKNFRRQHPKGNATNVGDPF